MAPPALVLVGLGVESDVPAVDVQPPLPDGIHLRWAFAREQGFPWSGFHLYRRSSGKVRRTCLAREIEFDPGRDLGLQLTLPVGTLTSDIGIRRTDDFPAPTVPEYDLGGGRSFLRFALPGGDSASRVDVRVGFRKGGDRRGVQDDVLVVGRAGGVPVASTVLRAADGPIVQGELLADGIEEIAFTARKADVLPEAALIELCYVSTRANARGGWEPLPKCPRPLTLPLLHPDYPASGFQPEDESAAETIGLERVLYGDPSQWAGDPFARLHEALAALVAGGPGAAPMADPSRASDIAGVATSPDDATAPPTLTGLHPLDMVLLASINPAAAQIVGLAWVDRTAEPGHVYDYLVIADRRAGGPADTATVLADFFAGRPELDGAITWSKRVEPAAPLLAPTGTRAYSLPLGATVAPGGGDSEPLALTGLVGLLWDRPLQNGVLLPGSAVAYHLWREGLGDGDAPEPSTRLGAWLTKAGPVLLGTPLNDPFAVPQRPPDWPPFPLHRIDAVTDEGWYGYRASGMDLFGRISEPSAPMPWHQWTPMPDPRPWYYVDPPGDAVIDPDAVQVLDKVPPPAPVGVEASALDPQDPYVIQDARYATWRAAVGDAVVGLRVRWRWTATQMRQAPDTAEFRVYWNAGTMPPAPDARVAANWAQRVHVVAFGDAVAVSDDGGERLYDVLLPAVGSPVFAGGVPLTPTLADPVAYAHASVSAADAAPHTADDPARSGQPFGDRPGNEGRLGAPSKVFRVRRERPAPPAPPPDAERVFASPADYHAHSFYTYRWFPQPHLSTHVFRAMDESVFAADRARRPRPPLGAGDIHAFPDATAEPRWDAAKRGQVAAELNGLNAFPHTPAGGVAARAAYRALSNDGLRVLAGLPGTEAAFAQMTIAALDPDDPANANRRGPDNPASFPVDPGLRAYVDTLDGRGTNRWFYRAAYVDGAHNRSALSLAGPPIWLPNVLAPRAPALTSVAGGERAIALTWASNREPDLIAYRVLRGDDAQAARDPRTMTLVHTEPVPAGEPEDRPAAVTWTDADVPALVNQFYAVIAVDSGGNASEPSRVVPGRAHDTALPIVPPLTAAWTATAPPAAARLQWRSDDETRVERRVEPDLFWDPIGDWRAPGTHDETLPSDPTLSWRFRLRVRKATGALKIGPPVPLDHL